MTFISKHNHCTNVTFSEKVERDDESRNLHYGMRLSYYELYFCSKVLRIS